MWVGTSAPYLSPRSDGQADAWSEEASATGQTGTQKLRAVEMTVPPADIAELLGVSPGEHAVVRRRLMLLDDVPVELTDSWYPTQIAVGTPLAEAKKIKGGAVTFLASLGFVPHEAREEIEFRPCTAEETIDLHLTPGAPVIVLTRTVLDEVGAPFEVSKMTMVAAGRRLRYRLQVG